MHPLNTTRHSISNWSEVEIDALRIAIGRAATACAARDPKTVSGDALIDLARLCALGQSWSAVVQTTALYIAAGAPSKPLLNQAYAVKIDAELHLKDETNGLSDAEAMLLAVPYDRLAAEAIDEAIDYMQFAHTADALTLDALREPLLLAQIRAASVTPASSRPEDGTTPPAAVAPSLPAQTLHDLYATGLAFAALQQLGGQVDAARSTVAELEAALPAELSSDDALPIAAARQRYGLLGKPPPAVALLASLSMPNKLPQLPAPRAITALLLFPDWCAQCVRMGRQFPESVFTVSGHEAYFYALLAETLPLKPKTKSALGGTAPKPTAREPLTETSTVVVLPAVLDQFTATAYPFLIVADGHGIVRVVQPVAEDALQPGGTIDTAIAWVGGQWPTVAPATPASQTPAVAKP